MLSYIVADEGEIDAVFGARLRDSLRPGGRIVCESNFCEPLMRSLSPQNLAGFRPESYSDSEETRNSWAGNDRKGRVIRAVIRKQR